MSRSWRVQLRPAILALWSAALIAGSVLVSAPEPARAATVGFQPGRIIDDSVFTNKNSMSVQEIQNFLNSKVPVCDTNHERVSSTPSNESAPWRCLKDYHENPSTGENNLDGRDVPAGAISAAQIIHNVAQQYSINPQVLIVTLQKEQGLVTDTWPYDRQYRTAMGFACPDTAPCDPNFFGFYKQMNQAGYHLRMYFDETPGKFIPYKVGTRNILFNPNSGCGSTSVNIITHGTAALYNYTPYQPNAAALAAGFGSGDACSAYGNRNFFNYFNKWFGSTFGADYASAYVSQSSYPTLNMNGTATVSLTYRNLGQHTWYDDAGLASAPAGTKPVHLSTSRALNRRSLVGSSWGGDHNRAAVNFATVYDINGAAYGTNPHAVKPGESAQFTFTVSAPQHVTPGVYREFFQPIVEGGSAMNDPGTFLDITVAPHYASTFVSQGEYPQLKPTGTATGSITYRNAGNVIWHDDAGLATAAKGTKPVRLATSRVINRKSPFGGTWGLDANRPSRAFAAVYQADGIVKAPDQRRVYPGQIVRFDIPLSAPANQPAGTVREYYQPIAEGESTMNDPGTFLDVTVLAANAAASLAPAASLSLNPGARGEVALQYTNTGNLTWSRASTALKLAPGPHNAKFRDPSWADGSSVAVLQEESVAPGGTGTFKGVLRAPIEGGTFTLQLAPGDSSGLFEDGTPVQIKVARPGFASSYRAQAPYPKVVADGGKHLVYLEYTNRGNTPWYDSTGIKSAPYGAKPVHLATGRAVNRASSLASGWAGQRNRPALTFAKVYKADGTAYAANPHAAQPGETVRFSFEISAGHSMPSRVYREYFQPIVEGGSLMNDPGTFLDIHVRAAAYGSSYAGQSAYPTLTPGGAPANVFLRYKNTGNTAWYDDAGLAGAPAGTKPVHLATARALNRGSGFGAAWGGDQNRPAVTFARVYEADGTTLAANQHMTLPGQMAEFSFSVAAPGWTKRQTFREFFHPIVEGGSPMNDPGTFLDIIVQ